MRKVDHVVIGAGAAGSATAWWLAREGHEVVLLERFERGHTRGSSHGATRIFRYGYPDPFYVRLAVEAFGLWRLLEDEAGTPLLDLVGSLDHGPAALVEPVAAALAAAGVPHEQLTPEAARERFPGMRFEGVVVHQPTAGRCRAADALVALQDRAAAHGAEVRFACGPATVEPAGDAVVVRVRGEELLARRAVVTAGPWVAGVVGHVLTLPPLTVTQEQVVHFPTRGPGEEWPSFIHWGDTTTGASARYGLRTPGEGVKVGGHHEGAVTHPDRRDFELQPERLAEVVRYVERWLPGLEPHPRAGATCLYTTTPTEDFLLDRVGPFVVGSACSGHGFKFAPLLGRLLAGLAMGADHPGEPFLRLPTAPAGAGWRPSWPRMDP